MQLRLGMLAALALSASVVSACSGGAATAGSKPAASGGASGGNTVAVKSLDTMRFDPPSVTVRAGQPVRLTLDNSRQALLHDWTIDDLDGRKVQVKASPNQQASVDFTVSKAGTYQVYCAEPGHKEAGMVGTLTVQ